MAIKFKPSVGKTKAVQSGGSLVIAVKEATGLPQMDPNGLTDSFVKTYLLPKRTNFAKKKTSTIKGTLDPAWNEELEYKLVSLNDLKTNRVLELSVWDFDRRGCVMTSLAASALARVVGVKAKLKRNGWTPLRVR